MNLHEDPFRPETVDEQVDQFLQIPHFQDTSTSAEMVQGLQTLYTADHRLQRVWEHLAQQRAGKHLRDILEEQPQRPPGNGAQSTPVPGTAFSQRPKGTPSRVQRRLTFQHFRKSFAAILLVVMLVGSLVTILHLWHQTPGIQSGQAGTGTAPLAGTPLPTRSLLQITMLDAAHGWALDENAVLKTVDGGQTWTALLQGGKITAGSSAAFYDAQNAWIVVPASSGTGITVYSTTTGGTDWHSTSLAANAPGGGEVAFVSQQVGWITVSPGGAGAGSEPVDIYQTKDGGATWRKIASSGTAADVLPNGGIKTGFSFKDPLNGWFTGTDASNMPWLHATHDGGRTWHEQAIAGLADGNGYQTMPPVFFGQQGFLPLTVISTSIECVLAQSSDGGQNWSVRGQAVASSQCNNVYMMNPECAWLTDQDSGDVYRTQDGGKSWRKVASAAGITGALSFVDQMTGFALGGRDQYVLKRTNDGGVTWSSIAYTLYA